MSISKVLILLGLLALAGIATADPIHVEKVAAGDKIASGDQFLTQTRQLTYDGKRSGEGYFSLDGKLLTLQSEREPENPWYQIYLLNLDTGDSERISPGTGKTTCSYINPADSQQVIFASTHGDPKSLELQKAELEFRASGKERRYSWDYDSHFDIYRFDRATKAYTQLTREEGYDAECAYSRDGKTIVFSSNRNAFREGLSEEDAKKREINPEYFADIYLMDADGGNVRQITDVPGYDGGPFFSYDGARIIWRRFSADGATADVYTADADGKNQKRITHFDAMSWAPFFHPSNEYVIFASNKEGFSNFELYLVDAEGKKEPVRVTYTDGFDGLPVFSPDGKSLVWTSNRKGASQLFMARWNHEGAREAIAKAPARKEDKN
ncbi:PD40 domain-containing protein [Candidatus Sumerlaeota bacterium]|nr:PD40 domain-containing protein [Candidatus Sumerlaeota bacterium]